MTTEIVKLNEEIKEVISQSNITDLTKAESYAMNYAPLLNEVTAQGEILKTLEKGNKDHVEKAKRIRIDLGKIASRSEAQKKKDKEQIIVEGRFIDALYNTVNGSARLTQNEAKEIEDYFEVQEQIRLDKLRSERWDKIKTFTDIEPSGLSSMTEDVFNAFESGLKAQHEAKIEAEKKAEAERFAKEQAEKQRIEAQRVENERLKKEAEVKEKERQAEAKKQAELLAKQKAESEAKLKQEREAREKIEAELESKRQAEIIEKNRIEDEEKKRLAEEKKLAKAPVKQKLKISIDSLSLELIDSEVTPEILEKFNGFKRWAMNKIESL